jgi:hypothetical protein
MKKWLILPLFLLQACAGQSPDTKDCQKCNERFTTCLEECEKGPCKFKADTTSDCDDCRQKCSEDYAMQCDESACPAPPNPYMKND